MDNKKLLVLGGVGFGGYLLFKSLQLRQTALNLQTYVQGVRFDIFQTGKSLKVIPKLTIVNPIGSVITVSNIFGTLSDDNGNTLGYFQTGKVVVGAGSTAVEIPIIVNGLNAFLAFTDAYTTNHWPKLTLNYTIALAGGILPIKDKLTFDTGSIQRAVNRY